MPRAETRHFNTFSVLRQDMVFLRSTWPRVVFLANFCFNRYSSIKFPRYRKNDYDATKVLKLRVRAYRTIYQGCGVAGF